MTKNEQRQLDRLENCNQQSMDDLYKELTALVTAPKQTEIATLVNPYTVKLRFFKNSTWKQVVPPVMGKLLASGHVSKNADYTYHLNGGSDEVNAVIFRVIKEGLEDSYKKYTDRCAQYYKEHPEAKAK